MCCDYHFTGNCACDVPKAAKPLAQIDRVHGIPEQIQVSVKGISTLLLIWQSTTNPAPIPANASGQCVQCILTFDTCIGRYWDMDWRWIGGSVDDWQFFLYLWLISGKDMVLYRSYWHRIGVFVSYWWIVVMPDSLIFCPATGLLRKLAFYWYRFGSELAMCLLDWAGWRWWWFLFCLPNQTFVRFFWITSLNQLYFYTILRTTRPK